jgi:hypothetical protein
MTMTSSLQNVQATKMTYGTWTPNTDVQIANRILIKAGL